VEGIRKSDLEVNKECLPFSMYIGAKTIEQELVREVDIGEYICKFTESWDVMVRIPESLKLIDELNDGDIWLKQDDFVGRVFPLFKRILKAQLMSALARDCLKQTKGE
jgi:hypothetical protein